MKIPEQGMWTGGGLCGLRAPRLGQGKGVRNWQVPTAGLGLSTLPDLRD